ncbi:inner membrane-spanning protein YciB [Paraphotobacterium marinum]|uniref:inner membrane-spanning protein YciB n=1 Tax=Paraphotobacterium marinum TaxID=1755811 RepID=UPI0039E93C06
MNALIEFIPLIIFFVFFKLYDIYTATIALIIVTSLQLLITWFITKKVKKALLFSLIALVILGGLTIFYKEPKFLAWKLSVVYFVFSIGLFFSALFNHNLIKKMLAKEYSLEKKQWDTLSNIWSIYFLIGSILNLIIFYNFSLDIWVDFKVFGFLILMFIPIGIMVFCMTKWLKKKEKN